MTVAVLLPDLFAFVPAFTSHETPPGARFGEPASVKGLFTACPSGFIFLQGMSVTSRRNYSTLKNTVQERPHSAVLPVAQLPAIKETTIMSPWFGFRTILHTLCHTAVNYVLESATGSYSCCVISARLHICTLWSLRHPRRM